MRRVSAHGARPCDQKPVVLITGAGSGIGKAAALRFLREGYIVYAGARRVERMEDLARLGARTGYLDVTDDESCRSFVADLLRREGRIDILVNNAGYGAFGPIEAVEIARAKEQLDVNLYGAVRLIRLVAPAMREQGGGRIVNISSAAGRAVTYLGGWYHAAKYALEAVSDSLRMELRPYGIDVVLIEPGGVRSAWGAIAAGHMRETGRGSVYQDTCDQVAEIFSRVYDEDNRMLTDPEKAADKIYRAATVAHPRPRYLFGFGARSLVALHTLLPDRAFDRLMTGMYRSKAARRFLTKNK